MAAEQHFRVMGSDSHVLVVDDWANVLVDRARGHLEELERRWSRFRPDSEISELNRRRGDAVRVSLETRQLVERAVEGWRLSGGRVDPTVLDDLVRAGYDRSYEALGTAPPAGWRPAGAAVCRRSRCPTGCEGIEIGPTTVRLPPEAGFDPGGLGKGLAADLVAEDLMAAGARGACVNVGGDLRVVGTGPGGAGWTVAVEHPVTSAPIALLGLADGAVATSTTARRRWCCDGRPAHHLIDPTTGRPSQTDLVQATVVAAEAWVGEVLAKDVLLRGSADPFALVEALGAEALVVDHEARIRATDGLGAFLGSAELRDRLDDRSVPGW